LCAAHTMGLPAHMRSSADEAIFGRDTDGSGPGPNAPPPAPAVKLATHNKSSADEAIFGRDTDGSGPSAPAPAPKTRMQGHMQSSVDDVIFGRDMDASGAAKAETMPAAGLRMRPVDYGPPAAGKGTSLLNSSFSGFDYMPSKMEKGRSFLMDDYTTDTTRSARRPATLTDGVGALLQYQPSEERWRPEQGTHQTKFHQGFKRREQQHIAQDAPRKQFDEERSQRLLGPAALRYDRLNTMRTFKYNGYDVITGSEVGDGYTWRSGKRHIDDSRHPTGGDAPVGRLRDSSARFFCSPDELPVTALRRNHLVNDGLTTTQRTSTIIGIGPNRAQEMPSIGVTENFTGSHYAQSRRQAAASQRAKAEDVALVQALR